MYELWRSGDRTAALELVAEDLVIDATQRELNPATYRGRDGVLQMVAETDEVWETFETRPDRWEAVGDASVVVSGSYVARSRGVELEGEYAEIWTVDAGKGVHWDLPYASREAAMAALREAGAEPGED